MKLYLDKKNWSVSLKYDDRPKPKLQGRGMGAVGFGEVIFTTVNVNGENHFQLFGMKKKITNLV